MSHCRVLPLAEVSPSADYLVELSSSSVDTKAVLNKTLVVVLAVLLCSSVLLIAAVYW
ncbi:hypothetical protein H8K35_13205 [Undibacterium sp. LX40W]|uniref:Uncharacterized protein n=1 Tax=Undibacterium nitidum TaxID=2762298 RepID=A0A923KTK5_9BURK|nr:MULTISPECIES: hypothetical protein [Undibacterium]MBC3882346.1 hypothetical protein [Undibacterium nitidum]MBC3892627.1 hypothetical protein [Undibacterium sp. LX40W]